MGGPGFLGPLGRSAWLSLAGLTLSLTAAAQSSPSTSAPSTEQRLERLEQHQQELERQLQQKDAEIQELKRQATAQQGATPRPASVPTPPATAPAPATPPPQGAVAAVPAGGAQPSAGAATETPKWGSYTDNQGFKLVNTDRGDVNLSMYTYARFLNQRAIESSYVNAFGTTVGVKQREDIQLQKVQIKFLGWLMDPKFRYFLYAWTSNVSQGLGAQVVLAGNLNYTFNSHLVLSAGITGLPGVRTLEGQFPLWLTVDNRLMADEFFRPSYTSGIWARGQITDSLRYNVMLGNNMSTLGVSAAQLDNHLNTLAGMLAWEPTKDYGIGFGDFENHETLSTRLGGHFTHSTEDKQSQPNTEDFENTQIRLSDGTVIFTPNIFGPGTTVNQLQVFMETADFGFKYHGLSLEGELYARQLNHFQGPGTGSLPQINDTGISLFLAAMVVPRTWQVYLGTSKIFGDYGDQVEGRVGFNYFPFKNRVVRWNTQMIYLDRAPAGGTAYPYPVGAKGFVFNSDLEFAL